MSSWLLAGGFALCGALLALDIGKFKDIFAELELPLPRLTAAMFVVGPWGWFALAVLAAGGVILNDLRFHSRILIPILTLVVFAMVLYIVIALFLPVLECPVARLGWAASRNGQGMASDGAQRSSDAIRG